MGRARRAVAWQRSWVSRRPGMEAHRNLLLFHWISSLAVRQAWLITYNTRPTVKAEQRNKTAVVPVQQTWALSEYIYIYIYIYI
jgi:hypothetical protein